MRRVINAFSNRSDYLFIIAAFFCGCYIFMRGIAAGIEGFSPEDYFLNFFSLTGLLTAILSRLLCNGLLLPARRILFTLVLFLLAVSSAYFIASLMNYRFLAVNQGSLWLSDILIFLAVIITARDRNTFKFYCALLKTIIVVVGIYAFYQRLYVIDYLHQMFNDSEVFRSKLFAKGPVATQLFIERIKDGWVGGGFEDAHALTAFALLLTFFSFGVKKEKIGKYTSITLFAGLLCIALSGSWYGILIAKVTEIIFLKREINSDKSAVKQFLTLIGSVGISSIFTITVTLIFFTVTDILVADVVFSVFWYIEIIVLREHVKTGIKNYEYFEGFVFILIVVVLGLLIFFSSSISNLGTFADLCRYMAEGEISELSIVWNTFISSPVFGWGLGNYLEILPYFQTTVVTVPSGIISLYLKFLADGGIILLGGFLFFVITLLFTGRVERREYIELSKKYNGYKKIGSMIILFAFIIIYFFVFSGLFDRMGVDCLVLEIYKSSESFLLRTGNYFPVIFHFLVNCFLLPVIALYIFRNSFDSDMDFTAAVPLLKLSLGAFLLFSFSGDYLYHSALSGYFWILSGMLVSRERVWGILNMKAGVRNILAYAILLLAFFWGVWGMWSGFARSSVEREALNFAGNHASLESLHKAFELTETALELSGGNADLYIQKADFLLQKYELSGKSEIPIKEYREIDRIIRKAIELRPFSGLNCIFMADFQAKYNIKNNTESEKFYRKAIKLNPFNARYCYLFALYLQSKGDYMQAREFAVKAVKLNLYYINDFRVGLNRFEVAKAREIAYQQ